MRFTHVLFSLILAVAPLSVRSAPLASLPGAGSPEGTPLALELFGIQNIHAWCVVPFDAKKRGPEERAAMLEKLGIRRFAYDWRAKDIPTFDAEIEALKNHGIELVGWWSPTSAQDPVLKTTLEVFKRQNVHPQLWVTGGGGPTSMPEEQAQRVESEANRIRQIVELAAPYGVKVELYNHNGWFGRVDNEVAIIERLKQLGIGDVGIVYNFSHGHEDIRDFPAIWSRVRPYVVTVNVTGMVPDGEKKIMPPSQGEFELGMMRVILESGWRGPVGIIAEQGGDAEVTLGNYLKGLAWLAKELARPGSGGEKPNFQAAPAGTANSAPPGRRS